MRAQEIHVGGYRFLPVESLEEKLASSVKVDEVEVAGHRVILLFTSVLICKEGDSWTYSCESHHGANSAFRTVRKELNGPHVDEPAPTESNNGHFMLPEHIVSRIHKTHQWLMDSDRDLYAPSHGELVTIPDFRNIEVRRWPATSHIFYAINTDVIYKVFEPETTVRKVLAFKRVENRVTFLRTLILGRRQRPPIEEWLDVEEEMAKIG